MIKSITTDRSRLLAILLLILLGGIAVMIFTGQNSSKLSFDQAYFAVPAAMDLHRIEFISTNQQVKLENNGGTWRVNSTFDADRSLQQLLVNMLQQLQTKRPVSRLSNDQVIQDLKESGTLVNLYDGDSKVESFYAGGIASQSLSYFYKDGDDRAFIVEIPGYNSYVSAIFNLTELQWRNRMVFNTPWQSLKSLTLEYPLHGRQTMEIVADGYFPTVANLPNEKLDTGKLVSFLEKYAYFETNEHIQKNAFPRYDSLSATVPMAIISIVDLDISNNNRLMIYPSLVGEPVHLAMDKNGDWSVIEQRRVKSLMANTEDFLLVPKE